MKYLSKMNVKTLGYFDTYDIGNFYTNMHRTYIKQFLTGMLDIIMVEQGS